MYRISYPYSRYKASMVISLIGIVLMAITSLDYNQEFSFRVIYDNIVNNVDGVGNTITTFMIFFCISVGGFIRYKKIGKSYLEINIEKKLIKNYKRKELKLNEFYHKETYGRTVIFDKKHYYELGYEQDNLVLIENLRRICMKRTRKQTAIEFCLNALLVVLYFIGLVFQTILIIKIGISTEFLHTLLMSFVIILSVYALFQGFRLIRYLIYK